MGWGGGALSRGRGCARAWKDVSRDRFVFGFFCTGGVTSRRRKSLRAFKTCGGMRALYTPKKFVRLGEGGFFLCDQGT